MATHVLNGYDVCITANNSLIQPEYQQVDNNISIIPAEHVSAYLGSVAKQIMQWGFEYKVTVF